ncbi:MAG TPA: HAMP domain-containing histidine kinase [Bacteroidales bacterium]|nr:HAMP domain-containing histidine kinase [Bacteroidales bacterium]
MNIYSQKTRWKISLLILGLIIAGATLYYTNRLAKRLSNEEKKKVKLWAEAMKILTTTSNPDTDINFVFKVIENNETIPVIVTNENEEVVFTRNIDSTRINNPRYIRQQLMEMKKQHDPIVLIITDDIKQFVFYKDSILLEQLKLFPFIQLILSILFLGIAYYAFSYMRKAEQNQVWIGLSKETAHQLGTPISSINAWIELLKTEIGKPSRNIEELEKDITRLELIAERFSKIGSIPELQPVKFFPLINKSISYLQKRVSEQITFFIDFKADKNLKISVNPTLICWVFENIMKNAADAIAGNGIIHITVSDSTQILYIDFEDNGKGMPKAIHKTIFKPGFTTKKRGWGLGLSLSKRIVETYHHGKIFVKSSDINKGTIIRVVLKKNIS